VAQLARLRVLFGDWRIIGTQSGTFIAWHRSAGEVVSAHTLAAL
jgi:hypothetical protein